MRWLQSRFLHLVLYKTYADLRAESERTYIGFLWWIIEPVVDMAVYYVVFGLFMQRGTGDFAPFLLVGLIAFRWFQTAVRLGGVSLIANAGLMRLVYLPKVVFPSVAILNVTVKFIPAFIILVVFLLLYGFPFSVVYTALPALLLIELLVIFAVTYVIAAIVPFVPDFWVAIDNGLTMLFFLSGVFFSGASLPEQFQILFYWNPFAHLIESYRNVLMYDAWPLWRPVLWTGASAVVGIVVGAHLLHRFDRLYPRSIR